MREAPTEQCLMFFYLQAAVAQLVERWLPKPKVVGSNPICRSKKNAMENIRGVFNLYGWC